MKWVDVFFWFSVGAGVASILFVLILETCPAATPIHRFGEESESCYPNATCDDGLECRGDLCVGPGSD